MCGAAVCGGGGGGTVVVVVVIVVVGGKLTLRTGRKARFEENAVVVSTWRADAAAAA